MKINDLQFRVFNKMNYILEIAKMIDGPDGPYLGWDFVGYYNNLPGAMRDVISSYPRLTEAKDILAAVREAQAASDRAFANFIRDFPEAYVKMKEVGPNYDDD